MASLKSSIFAAGKLGLAGATIVVIAWAVGVYQPDGTVAESQADILSLDFIKLSDSARFASGLESLGHDEPQSMSINGNVVHFSVNRSRKRPDLLMKEYQEEFVRKGINDKVWDRSNIPGRSNEMLVAAMTGSLVPLDVRSDYAALGGMVPSNGGDDQEALAEMALDEVPVNDVFSGHKYIEMFWDGMRRKTTVTATWSNEKFDYSKMRGEGDDLDVDPIVPACPGCSRVSRLRDLDPTRSYSSNIYSGSRSQQDVLDFYRDAMPKRGWAQTDASVTFNTMQPYVRFRGDEASLLQFSQGDRFLTILSYPDEAGRTTIHTVMSN